MNEEVKNHCSDECYKSSSEKEAWKKILAWAEFKTVTSAILDIPEFF